jgi:uncharacterized membrane protein YhaH (DUF805 family)
MSEKPTPPTSVVAPVTTPGKRGTIAYWYAGMILDLVHMPLVIGMVIFGATIWHGATYIYVVTAVVVLQVALLGCPVMWLTGWLKRKHDPAYQGQWSVTVWIYQRYGRLVGVAVFVFFLLLALLVRWLFVS